MYKVARTPQLAAAVAPTIPVPPKAQPLPAEEPSHADQRAAVKPMAPLVAARPLAREPPAARHTGVCQLAAVAPTMPAPPKTQPLPRAGEHQVDAAKTVVQQVPPCRWARSQVDMSRVLFHVPWFRDPANAVSSPVRQMAPASSPTSAGHSAVSAVSAVKARARPALQVHAPRNAPLRPVVPPVTARSQPTAARHTGVCQVAAAFQAATGVREVARRLFV